MPSKEPGIQVWPLSGVLLRRARRLSRLEVTSLPSRLFLEDSTLVNCHSKVTSLSLFDHFTHETLLQGCIFCTPTCLVITIHSREVMKIFRVRQRRLPQVVGAGDLKYLKQTMWICKLRQTFFCANSSFSSARPNLLCTKLCEWASLKVF